MQPPQTAASVHVKICGITNPADALTAAEAGADALGFVFFERSPRCVTFAAAAAMIRQLPARIERVGLFVNAPAEVVARAIDECGLTLLQFHGEESPEFCLRFGVKSMKAFRLRDAASLAELPRYRTHAWLLDAWAPDQRGGTGQVCDWTLAAAARDLGCPLYLAGGLTPENVAEAIRSVRPFAVDVSSGVEIAPGRKDPAKVRAFIQAARQAALER